MKLDLASFKCIHRFTETFLKTEPRLDILINNAGEAVEYYFPFNILHIITAFTQTKFKNEVEERINPFLPQVC